MKQHTSLAITCALIVIALISCASTDKTQLRSDKLVPEDTSQAEDKFITRMAGIDSIEIRMLESMPVQVKVIVGGYLSDGCTRIDRITQERAGNDFRIAISTKRPAGVNCPQVIVPFQETIPLDVLGLLAGTYTVTVNRVSDTFTLQTDNIVPE